MREICDARGLDPIARRLVWEKLLASRREFATTILITTHDMEEAEALCDRVAIMDQGVIAATDSPQGLVDALIATGFRRQQVVREATLEDVFLERTGHQFEDEAVDEAPVRAGHRR